MENREMSEDMQNALDHLTGAAAHASQSAIDEIEQAANGLGARRCVWYAGCYYCKVNGRWRLIRCIG